MLARLWGLLYSSYFRFWLKWLWRLLTGKCELQRVFEGAKEGARRTLGIGKRGWGGRQRERVQSRVRADVTAYVLRDGRVVPEGNPAPLADVGTLTPLQKATQ